MDSSSAGRGMKMEFIKHICENTCTLKGLQLSVLKPVGALI